MQAVTRGRQARERTRLMRAQQRVMLAVASLVAEVTKAPLRRSQPDWSRAEQLREIT